MSRSSGVRAQTSSELLCIQKYFRANYEAIYLIEILKILKLDLKRAVQRPVSSNINEVDEHCKEKLRL